MKNTRKEAVPGRVPLPAIRTQTPIRLFSLPACGPRCTFLEPGGLRAMNLKAGQTPVHKLSSLDTDRPTEATRCEFCIAGDWYESYKKGSGTQRKGSSFQDALRRRCLKR